MEAAVVGIPDPDWGESVHAVIATRPEAMMTVADVIELCRANLAGYKKPRSVEFVAELPKNAYGKVLKRELRDKYWAGHDRRIGGGSGAVARPREQ
jgi:acyl-CoA synthetase (AMP-forming)/AMP-acid ligase II